ncbi:unnamed protein product, partial [Effrenium voratum]
MRAVARSWKLPAPVLRMATASSVPTWESHYVNGRWQPSASGKFFDVTDSNTGQVCARVPAGGAAEVDTAVAAARHAFVAWAAKPLEQRKEVLQRVLERWEHKKAAAVRWLLKELGCNVKFARAVQVMAVNLHLGTCLQLVDAVKFQEKMPMGTLVLREPIGVVGCITPWNYPLNQIAAKIFPAMLVGCTVVLKPSEVTPMCAYLLAEAIHEAEVPAGVFNMVLGDGPGCGEALAAHPDVDLVSFTGSTRAGRRISEVAATTLKVVRTELGGKSAALLLEDQPVTFRRGLGTMFVVKRDGTQQEVKFDSITRRLQPLCEGLDSNYIDPVLVTQKVIEGFYNGISTAEVDTLAAETCAYMSQKHPDFSTLAARIAISNLHKNTSGSFSETCRVLYEYKDQQGRAATLLADDVWSFVSGNAEALDRAVDYKRDLGYDYFGFKTLEKSYLLRVHGKIVERPQHMIMRAACGIHCGDLPAALETYDLMSRKFFTHATPTLFNAGTPKPQMSSCFLLKMQDDSIEGIYDTLKQCAQISKSAGGIGVAISNIRASGAYIRGTNGKSNGLVPMLRNFNETARYVDQGGGKRKGSFAMYLEPWHADVFDFLELRKNHGKEEQRARDLFLGLWIPDLFMQRVKENGDWTLFCPNEAYDQETQKGLMDVWGTDFEALYCRLEREQKGRKTVKAQQLWFRILEAQMETGTPYMLYKDSCNRKSNQQNLGTIHCSNLCTEIVEYTSPDEVAVCNLASIALSSFADAKTKSFDFQHLYRVTKVVTKNLNKVIDRNYYPVPEARRSNLRHRPVGLGVQGLADAFLTLKLPFESPEAKRLNEETFETIYFAACEASCELAEAEGPYETYEGSPASKGQLQFDLWGRKPSERWDWQGLKQKIAVHGLRNSLLVAPMPTASTAQILGNNESFEPYTQNLYVRRVLSGEFVQVNRHLLRDLIARDLWTDQLRVQLIAHNGSVQRLDLPQDLKELYKTVWEIKQKVVLDMAADRGAYIDQSQSLNIHMVDVTTAKLSSMHFHGWQLGLKTGLYYLRTKAAADAIKFTVEVDKLKSSDSDGSVSTKVSETKTIEALKAEGPKYSCDADFPKLVPKFVRQLMSNSGQSCNALSRMLVPQSRYLEAVELAQKVAEATAAGHSSDEKASIGPLVSQEHWTRVQGYIETGIKEGARLVTGGLGKPEGFSDGFF